jgi:uncharacterized OB-fold protein
VTESRKTGAEAAGRPAAPGGPPAVNVGAVSRDDATAEFFDGTAAGRFLLRRCPDGHVSEPAAARCTTCGRPELEWLPATGRARLVSWAVTWGRSEAGADPVPTVLAIGELDEGPWWWSQLEGADPAGLAVGRRLMISYRDGGGERVPVFELATE